MKVDVTYSWIVNSVLVFVNCGAENEEELLFVEDFESMLRSLINEKLQGTADDDHSFLGLQFDARKKQNFETIFKRCTKTMSVEFGNVPFALSINYILK